MKVTRRLDAYTPVAEYEYDGLNRRIRKVVENCGDGLVPGSDDNSAVRSRGRCSFSLALPNNVSSP